MSAARHPARTLAAALALVAGLGAPAAANVAPDALVLAGSTIAENLAPGALVGTLTALDADVDDTHTFLLIENPFDTFALDAQTGALTAVVPLDFEARASYSVRARATDAAGAWIERTFTINVLDRNDAPTGVSLSVAGVPEDAGLDALVGTFRALGDEDAGETWTYTLEDDSDGRFALEGDRLRVAAPLDHEVAPLAIVEVTATDPDGASATSAFVLDIWDRNEAPLGVALDADEVAEDAAPGTVVGGLVAAGDPDAGDAWTFELRSTGVPFIVSGDELVTVAGLDFEARATWTMTIRVTDRGGKSVEAPVTVFVADVGEAPTGVALVGGGVAENAAPGTAAGTLKATDPDADDTHTFEIVEGAGFALVGATLVTTTAFDYEAGASRPLVVRATDAGGRAVSASVSVPVSNVDEPPTAVLLSSTTVNENTPVNAQVGFLSVVDPDGATGTQYLLIDDGAGGFRVENTTLRVAGSLDFEKTPTRDIVVRALTPSGAFVDQPFTITIADVDESASAVLLDATAVRENQPAATVVGTLAPSGDPDDTAGYTYTLLQNPGSYLTIVGDELRTTGPLNYEVTRNLNIRIRATSPAAVSVESQFQIDVLDEAEAPTGIVVSGATVQEAREPGVFVATLFAQGDPDQNDAHTYTLVENPDGAFSVSSNQLTTAKRLDYEARASYTLRARATDKAGLTVEADFEVFVLDVNEPPIGVELTPRTFPEDMALPGVIGTLTTLGDPDAGDRFTYTLSQNPEDRFDVIGDQLLLRKAADFEVTPNSFRIGVRVRDAGNLQAEGAFFVDVTNVNEPPGALSLAERAVAENAFAGTIVGPIGGGADPDANDDAILTVVDDADGAFALDAERRLVTTRPLDHEAEPSVSVTVRLTDAGGLYSESTWVIAVADQNEPPTDLVMDVTAVPEGAGVGWVVGTLAATGDPDAGATFTYTIVEDPDGVFALDGAELTLAAELDFEVATAHPVRLAATDDGGLSIARDFLVKVVDDNDAPVVGVADVALPDVVEDDDDPAGMTTAELFTALAVSDVDADADVVLRVEALDVEHGSWQLDGLPLVVDAVLVRGEARLRFVPAADYAGAATLTVSADDGFVRSAPATVGVTVTPVDDAPTIAGPELVEAYENAPVPLVVTVDDIDADEVEVTIVGRDIEVPSGYTTLRGAIADVNEALATLEVTPEDGFVGEGEVAITVDDLGGTGAGGPRIARLAVRVSVRAAPDLRVSRDGRFLPPGDDDALGTLGVGAWKIVWLDLENHGSQELALTDDIVVTGGMLVVRPAERLTPGAETRLAVAIRPSVAGAHEATLTLASTDVYPERYALTLSGNAVPVGDLVVTDLGRRVWSGLAHEIVDLRPGRTQKLVFTLSNVGAERLELVSAEVEGAVNAEVDVLPPFPILETDEPETLEVYVTPTAAGLVTARVVLVTDDPDAERFVFELVGAAAAQGGSRPVLGRLPGTLLEHDEHDDLGYARSGDEVAVEYTLTNLGAVALDPTSLAVVATDNALADLVADLPEALAPGESADVIAFVTALEAGPFAFDLALGDTTWTVTGIADAADPRPLRLHEHGRAAVLLDQLDMGPLPLGETLTVGLVIANATAEPVALELPLVVAEASLVDAVALQPDAALGAFAGAVVPLEIAARDAGPASFDLLWTADDTLHVASAGQVGDLVFATGGAPIDGTTLQLPLQKPGKEVTLPIELVNRGTGPLTLGTITFDGGEACGGFDPPATTVIEAGEALPLTLRLDPVVGPFACTLTVPSDDPARAEATLTISARGAATGDGGGCAGGPAGPAVLGLLAAVWAMARRRRRA